MIFCVVNLKMVKKKRGGGDSKEKKSTHEKLDVGKELEGKTYYLGRKFCFVLGKI